MAAGNRGFDWRSSNLLIFATATCVALAVGVVTYQTVLDIPGIEREARAAGPAQASPRCLEADRASVAQLAAFLQRNSSTDAPILERAIHTLNVARRHCLYDWDGRGLEDYRWLGSWLSEHS